MKRYAIFRTKWGYFGLYGTEKGLFGSVLPLPSRQAAEKKLLQNAGEDYKYDKKYLGRLQGQVTAYFEGEKVAFSEKIAICSGFAGLVYAGCRRIRYGQAMSYGQLAGRIGRANAGRAVGTALAKNRLALIIPCHRVIRGDGRPGGFSGVGGAAMKKRLLLHEKGLKK